VSRDVQVPGGNPLRAPRARSIHDRPGVADLQVPGPSPAIQRTGMETRRSLWIM